MERIEQSLRGTIAVMPGYNLSTHDFALLLLKFVNFNINFFLQKNRGLLVTLRQNFNNIPGLDTNTGPLARGQ